MVTLTKTERKLEEDCRLTEDLVREDLGMRLFKRLTADKRQFECVSFKFTIFENCYLRDCKFINCDFTGAMFVDTNLRGATFDGSRFDYARFTRTLIGHAILERHLPDYENVQLELSRNLRANFGQMGDTDGVNLAIRAELHATRLHYFRAAWSQQPYYRRKYIGSARFVMVLRYAGFVFLDFIWGNGESLRRVARTLVLGCVLVAILGSLGELTFYTSAVRAIPVFFGTPSSTWQMPVWLHTLAASMRLVLIGLFMSVLIRRFARR
jgi:hypothetical protein